MAKWWNKLTWRYVDGRAEALAGIISEWHPSDISSEKVVEDSLYDYLTQRLVGLTIQRQFRYDRITADLLIEDVVAVEIKLNLVSTREFQRLIGQLETYARWEKDMVIVLVGDHDPELLERIKTFLRKHWEETYEGANAQVIHIHA